MRFYSKESIGGPPEYFDSELREIWIELAPNISSCYSLPRYRLSFELVVRNYKDSLDGLLDEDSHYSMVKHLHYLGIYPRVIKVKRTHN